MASVFYDIFSAFVTHVFHPMNHVTVGLIFVLLVAAIYKYWNLTRKYSSFPSFSMIPFYVYTFAFRKFPKNIPFTCFIFAKFVSILKKHQREGVCIIWIGQPLLFIFGEESFKILSNEQAAVDKMGHYDVPREMLGTGLLTSNGETWRRHRKMLNPLFHIGMLKRKLPIFNEYAKVLVEKLLKTEGNPTVDVLEYLKYCSLNSLFDSIFGFNMFQENDATLKEISQYVDEDAEMAVYRICNPWFRFKFLWDMTPYGKRHHIIKNKADQLLEKFILSMEESFFTCKSNEEGPDHDDGQRAKSFAHILMEIRMKDPTFTMHDLKSHVLTFVVAGYDTVAYTLMWCLYMLGLHPDVQDRVFMEVDSITDSTFNFGNLHELRYLECVIKETLRLYAIVPIHGRRTSKDIQCGKYLVPKGTDVAFCPYMLHRNPTIYPNPEKFDPDRFLEENSTKRPWIYTPFSEGLRNCIGKRFAMMEMVVMTAHVIRNFKVTSLDKLEDVDFCWNILLSPLKPLNMKFIPRK